jgi:hypothetical protein
MQEDPLLRSIEFQQIQQAFYKRTQSFHGILSISFAAITVVLWLVLYSWYALFDHYTTPGFAFDRVPGHFDSDTLRYTALLFLALSLIHFANYWVISRASSISGMLKLATIITVLGSGAINILIYPAGAIDLFYYVAQLKLTFYYQQNPYLVTFVPMYVDDPFAKFGWPLTVSPPYGPAWLLISGSVTVFAGFDDLLRVLLTYKTFSLMLVILSGVLIARYQDDDQSKWLAAYSFVANPLVLFEAVGNGHNDIVMTVLLLAAVLALKKRSSLALPLLLLSALVKIVTIVLLPLFILTMYSRMWERRKILLSALLAFVVVVVVVAPFWSNGNMIGGIVRGMEFAHNLKTASIFSLAREYLQQQHVSAETLSLLRLGFGGLFAVSAFVVMWKSEELEWALVDILLLFYSLVSSLHPWYLIPVVGLLTLRHERVAHAYVFLASMLGLLFYPVDIWARFNAGFPTFQRHLFLAMFLTLPMLGLLGFQIWLATRKKLPKEGFEGSE